MDERTILLCGGTGLLGGEIADRLHERGIPFRALVRPGSDASRLGAAGATVLRGDLRDRASLEAAVDGVGTVISTVNAIGRLLEGERGISIRDVDVEGYENLIEAAESARAARFVYVSMLPEETSAHTPFTDAKVATERRLAVSTMETVIVRPDAFQEVWLGPTGGFDLAGGRVTVYGEGHARKRFVAVPDVAEAVVRLALADDPPSEVELAGPQAMSPDEACVAFEEALGRPLRRRHVPRVVLRAGRVLARPVKPELASIMGMALVGDLRDTSADDGGFRALGISPRPVDAYIRSIATSSGR